MFKVWVTFFVALTQLHVLLAACSCGQPGPVGPAGASAVITEPIFSGLTISAPGKWCWQVALESETGSIFCAAVLIDRLYAITPAQCIFGRQANTTFIRAGSSDLSSNSSQTLAVDRLILHEGYLSVETSNEFNIGVIKLANPIDCSSAGSGVCLACLAGRNSAALTGRTSCTATTWNIRAASPSGGKTVPRVIYERPAPVMDQMECESAIRNDSAFQRDYHLSDSKICLRDATNTSGCSSGVGDPLVCLNNNTNTYVLTGLNTIGYSCFRPTLPNFYVRVSNFVDWINKVIDRLDQNQPRAVAQAAVQPVIVIPVVVSQTSVPSSTTASLVGPVPVVFLPPAAAVVTGPGPTTAPFNQNPFSQPNFFSMQHMSPDGTLEQTGADGSVQRQVMMPTASLLQQISPGVFRANIGGGFVQVGPSGSQFIFPNAGAAQPAQPLQHRRKRDNVNALNVGVIAPNSASNSMNVPLINVQASDVTYNAKTGKLEFALPQGQTAFSSVSFVPSSVDSIRDQIIAQQDRILAQVSNANRNILISISNNFPGFNGSPTSSSSTAVGSSNGASVARAAAASASGMGPQTNSRSAVIPNAPVSAPSQNDDDYDDGPSPSVAAIQTNPVSQNNGLRPAGGISSSANAGGSLLASDSGLNGGGGFRTVINSAAPSAGSLNTHFESGNSRGDAGIKFKGAKVKGETRHAPGSSFSSVSASSN